jgi:hypothetical protein
MASSAFMAVVTAALAAAVTGQQHQACTAGTNLVTNGGFDVNPRIFGTTRPFAYIGQAEQIEGWENRLGGIALCRQGCPPWGGLHSNDGGLYVVMQGGGSFIEQAVSVEVGRSYTLRFLVAERPGLTEVEQVSVLINDNVVLENFNPPEHFTSKTVSFVGPNSGQVRIRFGNTSPSGDSSIMLDQISVCADETSAPTPAPPPAPERTVEERLAAIEDLLPQLQSTMALQSTTLTDRIANIETVITEAVAALPVPPVPGLGSSCIGTSCVPNVAANTNNIEISAAGGDVTINTGTCGSVNPCDIVYALNALRQLA